jgi:hypothetical protein
MVMMIEIGLPDTVLLLLNIAALGACEDTTIRGATSLARFHTMIVWLLLLWE